MVRSTRQKGLAPRLQDYKRFQDNKINDDGDFVQFTLMDKSKFIKTEDALSVSKWIRTIKEEHKLIEKNKT